MVLRDPTVDVAVLETARGGILREGLGFKDCDVGAVTNVQPDHLGLKGIETVEDLGWVKRKSTIHTVDFFHVGSSHRRMLSMLRNGGNAHREHDGCGVEKPPRVRPTAAAARSNMAATEGRWRAVGEGSGVDVRAGSSVSRIVTSWWFGFLLIIEPCLKAAET